MKNDPSALGRHIILELYDCPADLLKAPAQAEKFLLEAAERMEATVVNAQFHAFSPYGVSGVVVIQESHLTIHTWPEHQYAAIDIFTCGTLKLEEGIAYLCKAFQSKRHWQRELARGLNLDHSKTASSLL
ncbi:MAG: adenosylmethionine decarboxylase [Lewinella sp.]|uniref:adenosylmethionine decarboxylase n=1 Tax=Lewinella sp. TaxID=2004506 RepID=UPI003D6AA5D6